MTLASTKAFYSQRIAHYADPDPGFSLLLPLFLPYLLVIVPNLFAWTVALAYSGYVVGIMMFVTLLSKYTVARITRKTRTHAKLQECIIINIGSFP